ncbi:MAG TPA: hypothetical protein VGI23_16825 [Steroidobacteraceae bacterium]
MSDQQPSRRAALIGLVIVLTLIIGGLFLVHVLTKTSRIQDCVMSGRTNCAPIP